MSDDHKTVRVFISSTFRDMHAERDHLVTVVFPELREQVKSLGLEFFDVDLRWGVPETGVDGEKANSWEYCRRWIDRVEPFFVCMLGQRYGWVPRPHEIKDDDDRKLWAGRSVTDMEIHHAVLSRRVRRRSTFYLRETLVPEPPRTDPAVYSEFSDTDSISVRNLEQLKVEIRTCGRPVRPYACRWTGQSFEDLDAFGRLVLDDLWSGVLREERYVSKDVWRQALGGDPDQDPRYTDESKPVPPDLAAKLVTLAKPPPKDPVDAERDQMEAFAQTRLRWFQGRTRELQQLTDFINSSAEDAARLAVVASAPGQGKSALLARLWQDLAASTMDSTGEAAEDGPRGRGPSREEPESSGLPLGGTAAPPSAAGSPAESTLHPPPSTSHLPPSTFLVTHFVGATERSATVHALVQRLLDELDRSGIEWPADEVKKGEEPKSDFNSLCNRLRQRLGDYAGDCRIIILLDALNQLTDGHDLHWLPNRLGPSVRVVVSCIDDSGRWPAHSVARACPPAERPGHQEAPPEQRVLHALTSRQPAPLRVPLVPLTEDDIRAIVVEYLKEYCHELDRRHLDALCAIPQAGNPLYLLVMLNELRTLGGNDLNVIVPARIASMSRDYPDTVALFRWVLQRLEVFGAEAVQWWCLYLAHGRVGMASQELADLLARKLGVDARTTALRVERGLRRYLLRRGGQLDFFHSQLRQAVVEHYGPHAEAASVHGEMADYFRDLADPEKNQSWKGGNPRPFLQVVFHLVKAERSDDYCQTLCDLRFVEARCRFGQVFELSADYERSLCASPGFERHDPFARQWIPPLQDWQRECIQAALAGGEDPYPDKGAGPVLACLRRQRITVLPSLRLWFSHVFRQRLVPIPMLPPRATFHMGEDLPSRLFGDADTTNAVCEEMSATEKASARETDDAVAGPRRVAAFEHFVAMHTEALRSFPRDTAVIARNSADSGPVSEQGDSLVQNADISWVERFWRPHPDPLEPACIRRLEGHDAPVLSVALAETVEVAASGDAKGTVRIWDLRRGWCSQILRGHIGPVTVLSVSVDGNMLLSGGTDGTLRVWNARSGVCACVLRAHRRAVRSLALTSDGKMAFSAGEDRSLRIWDVAQRKCIRTLRGPFLYPRILATPDGMRFMSATCDWAFILSIAPWDVLRFWDVASGRCLFSRRMGMRSLELQRKGYELVQAVAIATDASVIVAGLADHSVSVWDTTSGTCLRRWQAHSSAVGGIALSRNGRLAVSTCGVKWEGGIPRIPLFQGDKQADRSLRVWDVASGRCLRSLKKPISDTYDMATSPNGSLVITGDLDKTVRVWDLAKGRSGDVRPSHSRSVTRISTVSGSTRAVSASSDRTLRVWDLCSGDCSMTLRGHTDLISAVVLSQDEMTAVSGGHDLHLRMWDLASGRCVREIPTGRRRIDAIALSSDGRTVLWGDDKGCLHVADLVSGHCRQAFTKHAESIEEVLFTPDGKTAISADEKMIRIWDLREEVCRQTVLVESDSPLRALASSQDGSLLAWGGEDGLIHIWDVLADSPMAVLAGHSGSVSGLAFANDGRTLISGAFDGTVRVWQMRPHECLAVYPAGQLVTAVVAVAPSGAHTRFLCGTFGGEVHFLELHRHGE